MIRDEARSEEVPRRMYIKKSDVEEHGHTVRCLGCISILRGRRGKSTVTVADEDWRRKWRRLRRRGMRECGQKDGRR